MTLDRNIFGNLFEKEVLRRFPQWEYTGNRHAMPDFDVGPFFIEAKTGRHEPGIKCNMDQLSRNCDLHKNVGYLFAFHDYIPLTPTLSCEQIPFNDWFLISRSITLQIGYDCMNSLYSSRLSANYLRELCQHGPRQGGMLDSIDVSKVKFGISGRLSDIKLILDEKKDCELLKYFG